VPALITLSSSSRAERRDKGSRFIADAHPARDPQEAMAVVEKMRSEFADATHHCWAYSIVRPGGRIETRSHDAGEPKGTAGPPILQAIRGSGVADVVVVVTRYFGGTKLGKGGLARAYRACAQAALEAAPRIAASPSCRVLISVPLSLDGGARNLVARHGGRLEAHDCDEPGRSVLRARVPLAARARLEGDVLSLARGDALVRDLDELI
jgi:putative IMPACT (imprinted ancient) family translation regulator